MEYKFKSQDKTITVEALKIFDVKELNKKYVVYGIVDDNNENTKANLMIGELIENNGDYQVMGIKTEEKDIALSLFQSYLESLEDE